LRVKKKKRYDRPGVVGRGKAGEPRRKLLGEGAAVAQAVFV